mmetsp:Transcript_25053/g.51295  ORF Transcript_25053/g.51295 Transcript_25053/m.51295 type:complete len:98 (-) Transcript_25053:891-1184(-)
MVRKQCASELHIYFATKANGNQWIDKPTDEQTKKRNKPLDSRTTHKVFSMLRIQKIAVPVLCPSGESESPLASCSFFVKAPRLFENTLFLSFPVSVA